ncbi:aromatic ring-opening dioxygenase LigA [Pseudoscardovia radai]|uniref:Aromatic ring-opening dioxygenase LigA n=1 Tax=Pseudoscardovia radai TaxID=987066 RepID=A0A261ERA4_9BIFI|nr:hypothetical protein [Pseudoscardovia radai]OZG49388.1 aromatic ring-opening dioxygenase LigA [Pseudoscardovia radai]
MTEKAQTKTVKLWSVENSETAYYCGPCYEDIRKVVAKTLDSIRSKIAGMTWSFAVSDNNPDKAKGRTPFGWILRWIVQYIFWICYSAVLVIAGVVFCLFMLLPHVVVSFAMQFFGIIGLGIARLIDDLSLRLRRVSLVCDRCHSRFKRPVYVCPSCGAMHALLFPNKYGALHHTCTCGMKLASSVLVAKDPRRNLTGVCPECLKSGHKELVAGAGSRTICVPVVGGASSGKTALITAYVNGLMRNRASANDLTIQFDNENADKVMQIDRMASDYANGVVAKTATVTTNDRSSAFATSIFIQGKDLKPRRLLQMYDIAGETFVDNNVHEQQRQYEHCDGIILVIDPMTVGQAQARFGGQLSLGDWGAASTAPLQNVLDALNNTVNEVTNIARSGSKVRIPLAVVLNKVDEAPALETRIGQTAVRLMQASAVRNQFADDCDTMDFLCRQFFADMDEMSFVANLDANFAHCRYFSVSAIGHTAGAGTGPFMPRNVDLVMDWIIDQSDPKLAQALNCRKFSKAKLPVIQPYPGIYDNLVGQINRTQV